MSGILYIEEDIVELSIHAHERIQYRTRMLDRDVLALVSSSDAVISLGRDERYEYLLFFAPPDNAAKVAVVSSDGSVLVSVWLSSFALPDGITPVTEDLVREVRKRCQDHLFKRIKLVLDPGPRYHVRFLIFIKTRIIHRKVIGSIPVAQHEIPRKELIVHFGTELRAAATQLTHSYPRGKGIRFQLDLMDPATMHVVHSHNFSRELLRRVKKA